MKKLIYDRMTTVETAKPSTTIPAGPTSVPTGIFTEISEAEMTSIPSFITQKITRDVRNSNFHRVFSSVAGSEFCESQYFGIYGRKCIGTSDSGRIEK